jgi:hypothetical protein
LIFEPVWGSRGRACQELGEIGKACDLWRQALKIYEEIQSPDAEEVRGWIEGSCER